jgi:hypothetical protein
LFAIGEDIDASSLLGLHGQSNGVISGLLEVGFAQSAL